MSSLFVKYPSLTNAHQQKFLDNVRLYQPKDTKWVVTEKIHGANFQVIFDKQGNISYASRNQHLGEFGSFFDLPGLKRVENNGKTLVQRLTDLHQRLKNTYGDLLEQVNLYGEYAGRLTQGNSVQKEVQYGEQEFYLFDIFITLKEHKFAMNKNVVRFYAETCGLAQPALLLVTDNLDKALSFPNDFDSVSGEHRYTKENEIIPVEVTGKNITEGVVIEPNIPWFYGHDRVIIKNKNQKFSEKHTSKPIKNEKILTEDEQQFLEQILPYANKNRVSNVCSHYGIFELQQLQKQFSFVLKETLQDAINDIKKDGIDISNLDKVIKIFNKAIADAVREHLLSL